METIIYRGYINKDGAYLIPTDLAFEVIKLLKNKFENVVDYKFTAHMEKDLDRVANGKMTKKQVLDEFWIDFAKNLEKQKTTINKSDYQTVTKEKCPECKKSLVEKWGRFGKFLACSGFPECKYSRPLVESGDKKEKEKIETEIKDRKCPKCKSPLVLKESRFGQFLACTKYPECKFTESILKTTGQKCPDCEKGDVVVKKTKKGKTFWGCSNYPKCKYASWTKPGENNDELRSKNQEEKENNK
jgi:DNA topoisomerase-1